MFHSSVNSKMPFGKHRGKTFDTIYQEDPSYLHWMVQAGIFRNGINYSRLAADYLESQKENQKTTYKCCECGKQSNQDVFSECPFCADSLCVRCYNLHDTMHKQARATSNTEYQYAHRREYRNTSNENMEDFLNRMFGGQGAHTSSPPYVSPKTVAAFSLLQLSTRATVQEVKRARNRLAKQGEYRHPDVGGVQAKFVELNNAYELALQHAERNER